MVGDGRLGTAYNTPAKTTSARVQFDAKNES